MDGLVEGDVGGGRGFLHAAYFPHVLACGGLYLLGGGFWLEPPQSGDVVIEGEVIVLLVSSRLVMLLATVIAIVVFNLRLL